MEEKQPKMDPLIAVDVGNSGVKFGVFEKNREEFAEPLVSWRDAPEHFRTVFHEHERLSWWISSVNRTNLKNVTNWIASHRPNDRVVPIRHDDVPLDTSLPQPQKIGLDRLAAAYAARRWMLQRGASGSGNAPLLVCDIGTAVTIDLVSPEGRFEGGAILPGLALAAQSLARGTDLIPSCDDSDFANPDFPGKTTREAVCGGVLWGVVGAIRQFRELARISGKSVPECPCRPERFEPLLLLTGTLAPKIAAYLCDDVRSDASAATGRLSPNGLHVFQNLVLSGIALIAAHRNDH